MLQHVTQLQFRIPGSQNPSLNTIHSLHIGCVFQEIQNQSISLPHLFSLCTYETQENQVKNQEFFTCAFDK